VSKGLSEASFKVMSGILQYLPIGIFAIIAKTVGEQGTDALKSLGSMVGVFYLAIIVQMLFYGFILILYRVNLKEFFVHTRTPILDRKSTRLNSSHVSISYAVFCLK